MEKVNQKQENKNGSRPSSRITVGMFLLLVFGITVAGFFSPIRERSESENRALAQKPEFSFESLFAKENDDRFTTKYESYLTDQFVGRDMWIGVKTRAERLIGKTDINGVYFAKDGYLITKTGPDDVDEEQQEKNIARLVEFVEKYSQQLGSDRLHVMIVPTAADIFADKLPAFVMEYDQKALLDRMSELLGEHYIDVRGTLLQHSDEYLYYRTDHHWTALGAYYAYRSWAEVLGFGVHGQEDYDISAASEEFYGTLYSKVNLPMRADTVTIYDDGKSYRVEYDMDGKYNASLFSLSRLEEKDKYMVYLDGNHAMVDIVQQGAQKNGRKLLVVKDSYAHTFVPLIAQYYDEVIMVDFRYNRMPVSMFIQNFGITDVLVLYNATNFVQDENLYLLER